MWPARQRAGRPAGSAHPVGRALELPLVPPFFDAGGRTCPSVRLPCSMVAAPDDPLLSIFRRVFALKTLLTD